MKNDKQIKPLLEKELLKIGRADIILFQKNQALFKKAIADLADILKGIRDCEKLQPSHLERVNETLKAFGDQSAKMFQNISSALVNVDNRLKKQLGPSMILNELLRANQKLEKIFKKETFINVEPPKVNVAPTKVIVPEPKVIDGTKIIQETKYIGQAVKLLMAIFQLVSDDKKISRVFVENAQPDQAISVKLVDRSGRSFYDAVLQAVSSSGGPRAIHLLGENGNPISVSNPLPTSSATYTINNGAETSVSSSAVEVLAANANRKKAVIQNTGLGNVRVGVNGVTATTGMRLVPNGHVILESTQAIYAIRETVDSTVFAQEFT